MNTTFHSSLNRFQNKRVNKFQNKIANKHRLNNRPKTVKPFNENRVRMFQDKNVEM